ncbi:MAG: hypothetical protein AAFQ58_21945 [Pseudomonadota bacterium]
MLSAASADDLSIIINRGDTFTEVYMSSSAEVLFATFDVDPSIVPMRDNLVDYTDFASGTWAIGDTLLTGAKLRIDQQVVQPEAMSFMLHPSAETLSFETPLDGLISIGVCNAFTSDQSYQLSDLTGYVGYYIDHGSMDSTFDLALTQPLTRDLNLTVFDYGAATHTRTTLRFSSGATLSVALDPPQQTTRLRSIVPYALALLIAAKLLHGLFARTRAQKHCPARTIGLSLP